MNEHRVKKNPVNANNGKTLSSLNYTKEFIQAKDHMNVNNVVKLLVLSSL
jgi:hypothetical protein